MTYEEELAVITKILRFKDVQISKINIEWTFQDQEENYIFNLMPKEKPINYRTRKLGQMQAKGAGL